MPQPQVFIPVSEESQVGEARRAAARVAADAGMDDVRRGEVAIVVTELANNLRKYGKDGRLILGVVPGPEPAVQVLAVDKGPGMADPGRCMSDGFSTGGTTGTGLGAVRRIAAEFDLHSAAGAGTVVMARVSAVPPADRVRPAKPSVWGAVSSPAPGEVVCGDVWRVALKDDGGLTIMVADGLGHGLLAAEAANVAAAAFDAGDAAGPRDLLERAHGRLSGTRGAAVAVAAVGADTAGGRLLRYAGVGNIAGSLVAADGKTRGLASHNGTLGVIVRRFQEFEYPLDPAAGLLVMHSDGLQTRWSLAAHPGLAARHPAVVAAVLHRDHVRGRDDATVVVARLTAK